MVPPAGAGGVARGVHYVPRTAVNPIEMWQAEMWGQDGEQTPHTRAIAEELGLARELGFNSLRVFLHIVPWETQHDALVRNVRRFLDAAKAHDLGVMFVLFDSVWDPFPVAGRQREPRPNVHNSGWVQCPGLPMLKAHEKDDKVRERLRAYVQGVVREFKSHDAVHLWDLFNEPDNINRDSFRAWEPDQKEKERLALALLRQATGWARAEKPPQPITSGLWQNFWSKNHTLTELEDFQVREMDVISFHNYDPVVEMEKRVRDLRERTEPQRPILCTEYMARPKKSTFESILPFLKDKKVGAYSWGLVAGRTQTHLAWDSWKSPGAYNPYTGEPDYWFHDIYRQDLTPYDPGEIELIRKVTGGRR